MKVSIEQAVVKVNECMSSVFTKNDVLNLLQSIEMKKENLVTKEMLVTFITDYVETQVERLDAGDILDLSSAEFELNGNEITLESVDIDTRDFTRNILGDIDEAVDTFLNYDL
jgi:septum formation inhibitor-activating ATPase MinD